MEINPIDLRKIEGLTSNIYEAVIVISKKSRDINSNNKLEFNSILSTLTGGIEDDFDDKENPDQLRLSVEFEARKKPHLIATEQLLEKQLEFYYKEDTVK